MAAVAAAAPAAHVTRTPDATHAPPTGTGGAPSSAAALLGGDVEATLNFYDPPAGAGEAPYYYVEEPPAGTPRRNFGDAPRPTLIRDIRGRESDFELDRHAFAALRGQPAGGEVDWADDASIRERYYPEVVRLLAAAVPGAAPCPLIFDHTIRRAAPGADRAPVTRVHIDQTPASARARVSLHLTEAEAAKVFADGVRYRIINVWRPLNGAVESFPLAFADSGTVADGDMVAVQHRYPERTGETAAVRGSPAHRWHYWSGMGDDERLLLQCFDSANPGNRVPHTAFTDPRSTAGSKARESIEVRALVFG